MKLNNLLILHDKRTNCISVSATTSIKEYIAWFEEYGKQNKLDEQRTVLNTRSGNMIRHRLIEDLKQGALIPPLVIGLALNEMPELVNDIVVNDVFDTNKSEATVIDGMQRSEALSQALRENSQIADSPLRIDLWIAKDTVSLIYRMLVLNTGQVPWDVKRQMEVIYKPLVSEIRNNVPNIKIIVKNDNERRTGPGEYQASNMIELFIAFTSRKEIVSPTERIADDFIRLDVADMAGQPGVSELFYRTIRMMVQLDSAFSKYQGTAQYEESNLFKTGKDIFSKVTAQVGFVVAVAQKVIGMPGMNERDQAFQNRTIIEVEEKIERICDKVSKLSDEKLATFMAFDYLNEQIRKLPTKKIGNAQREFFKAAFRALIDTTNDVDNLSFAWLAY